MKIKFVIRMFKKYSDGRECLILRLPLFKQVDTLYSYREAIDDVHHTASLYLKMLGGSAYTISEQA